MIDALFKEQISKNSILTNKSNMVDFASYELFSGDISLNVSAGTDGFGFINVDVVGAQSLSIAYNGRMIFSHSGDKSKCVPCRFKKTALLEISGNCDKVCVSLVGGKFSNYSRGSVWNLNNCLYRHSGNNKVLCKYIRIDDIVSDKYEYINYYECMDLQPLRFNDSISIGKIFKNDAVYYCSSVDDYANSMIVSDNADYVHFVQDVELDEINFFWILDDKIFSRKLDSSNTFSDGLEILNTSKVQPIGFATYSQLNASGKFFGVRFINDVFAIFCIKPDNLFEKVLEIKAKDVKIYEDSEELYIIIFRDYCADVCRFSIDLSSGGYNILNLLHGTLIENVVDCDIVNGKCVCLTTGLNKIIEEMV